MNVFGSHRRFRVSLARASAALLLVVACSGCAPERVPGEPPELLSYYDLFAGDPRLQQPANDVVPYTLNTALFSDYAEKYRFVKLPEGQQASWNGDEPFEFPVGTVIAKTFAYAGDEGAGLDLVETRILERLPEDWLAMSYIWNEDQTDAELAIAGGARDVELVQAGETLQVDYRVPNMNQCKGCHRVDSEKNSPIGPRPAQLNGDFDYEDGRRNQLAHWVEQGVLQGAPPIEEAPRYPVWDDEESGSLDRRARVWLEINCAHCHNPEGPARTSNLDLRFEQEDPRLWGVHKRPVAAGRGSGDRLHDIVPGHPEQSILLYRLESLDPGVMMPELGRSLLHSESIALIREWIETMQPLQTDKAASGKLDPERPAPEKALAGKAAPGGSAPEHSAIVAAAGS